MLFAHLSRRLTGELIGYPLIRRPSVRPSSSVVRPFTFSMVMGRVCMGRVGYGPSLSWAEFVMGRDVQLPPKRLVTDWLLSQISCNFGC